MQVHRILGERGASARRRATEYALRRGETVGLLLSCVEEETEDLDEVGAADRHVDGEDAQAVRFMRAMSVVDISSANTANPSCVAVMRGEASATSNAAGHGQFSAVSECTKASWLSGWSRS